MMNKTMRPGNCTNRDLPKNMVILERPHLQGPFSLGTLNPQSSPADINIVDGWASTCVCWFGISLEQHCNLFPANSLQHLRPGITHARSRVAIGNRLSKL